MSKVAFVIPLHQKHYELAREFIQSFKKYGIDKQSDLYFVLSTKQDLHSFDSYIHENPVINSYIDGYIDNYGGGGAKLS